MTVVIRSVGERTEEMCYTLLARQISEKNIHIIRETPFANALNKTFEYAIKKDRKWTFVVDADVLLKQYAIVDLIDFAETRESNIFEIHGDIICKFFGGNRDAGNHLYRTALMPEALKFISQSAQSIRPETHVIRLMSQKGFHQIKIKMLVGLHDFEQYYRDIYRKSFVQAKKHYDRVNVLFPFWQRMASMDSDFSVAIEGFNNGVKYNSPVTIDASIEYNVVAALEKLRLTEKESVLNVDGIYDIAYLCGNYRSPKEYYCIFHDVIQKKPT